MGSSKQEPELKPAIYKKKAWKEIFRYLALGAAVFIYGLLLSKSYETHFVLRAPFNPAELVTYALASLIILPGLPSLLFEVSEVQVLPSGLKLKGLLGWRHLNWQDIKEFRSPPFFKFAILVGDKHFFLLHKYDLPEYEKLIKTIFNSSPRLQS